MLLHCLTVRETFLVAAKLRLPGSVTAAEKVQVVEAVISELGLVKAANTKIGNSCAPSGHHVISTGNVPFVPALPLVPCLVPRKAAFRSSRPLLQHRVYRLSALLSSQAIPNAVPIIHDCNPVIEQWRTYSSRVACRFVRGVSGGERKRCNIGVEMMSNPR